MNALDLFCCAGGASMGLYRAGFNVTGIDIEDQPHYPFPFLKGDALSADLSTYDFIWASPPCQAFTAYKRRKNHVKPKENLIPIVRELLQKSGKLFVIENVVGAPLNNPILLCGSMFGLDVKRHRIFEANFKITQPTCAHNKWTARFKPATNRTNLRKTVEIGVWRIPQEIQAKAMGIDWMPVAKLSQAIPPAYAEYIAKQVPR